jgi:hypothetical protein
MRENPTLAEKYRRRGHAVSENYKGDDTLRSNQTANISDDGTCSLWITDLPPVVSHQELLSAIYTVDRVRQVVINHPSRKQETSAAKITFFDPRARRPC